MAKQIVMYPNSGVLLGRKKERYTHDRDESRKCYSVSERGQGCTLCDSIYIIVYKAWSDRKQSVFAQRLVRGGGGGEWSWGGAQGYF